MSVQNIPGKGAVLMGHGLKQLASDNEAAGG